MLRALSRADDAGITQLVGAVRCSGCRTEPGPLCETCRKKVYPALGREAPSGVARLLVPWSYGGPVRSLVLDLKLRGHPPAAGPLVDAMASEVSRRGLLGNLLTWVPARSSDNRRRGHDHAEVLARALAGRLGLRAEPLLERRGTAEDQAGLNKEERRRNLEHAFAPGGPCTQPVVLIDDVITTGATLAACARALRKAGVPRVEAVVACSAD